MFKVSEGTIEQFNGDGPLKIVPLTSGTYLTTNRPPSWSLSRVSKETIEQHNGKGLLKVVSLTLKRGPISKLFNYV